MVKPHDVVRFCDAESIAQGARTGRGVPGWLRVEKGLVREEEKSGCPKGRRVVEKEHLHGNAPLRADAKQVKA